MKIDLSGTTAVVAVEMGMRYVGYEIDETYVRMAKRRIRRVETARRLFDEAESKA